MLWLWKVHQMQEEEFDIGTQVPIAGMLPAAAQHQVQRDVTEPLFAGTER